MPYFSVVIPLYNKQKDIAATLRSVFAQTFADIEVIVINDGSTDDGEKEVLQFNDNRLVYVKTENQGVSQARNLGIEKAKAEYVVFLDADDYWFPDHLETLTQLIAKYPDAGLYATNYRFAHPHGALQKTDFSSLTENFEGIVDNVFRHSLRDRLMCTICIAVKKEVFSAVGMFDPILKTGPGEDTGMWIRIALQFPVAFTKKVTAQYNLGGSNRISLSPTSKRAFPTLDEFAVEEKTDFHLKKYLDLYRSDYALKHKLIGDMVNYHFYRSRLDVKNISGKINILLRLPAWLLRILFSIKQKLKNKGIFIDIYN